MEEHGLCCAFAESIVRELGGDREVVTLIQNHLGNVDITSKDIKLFLYGVNKGAHGAYNTAMRLYSPIATVAFQMANILSAAMPNVSDIEALKAMQDALDTYSHEQTAQVTRHDAISILRIELKWGVPERIWLRGDEPTPEDIATIAAVATPRAPILLMLVMTFGVEGAFAMFSAPPGEKVPEVTPLAVPQVAIENEDFVRLVVRLARNEYAQIVEEGMGAFELKGTDAVDMAMQDFTSRFGQAHVE